MAVTLIICTAALVWQTTWKENNRVHQHLATPQKTPCTKTHADGELCTHIPLLMIDTGGVEIPGGVTESFDMFGEHIYSTTADGAPESNIRLRVVDNETSYNHPSDVPKYDVISKIRIRGHSSRKFEKAPYLLKLTDGNENDMALPLLGMDEHSEWILHGPHLDKSLLRNYLFYNIAGEVMDYAPNCRFCELILDGDYRGVYLLTESITAGKKARLPLTKANKGALLSGYLLRIDRPTEEDLEGLRDVNTFAERAFVQTQDIAIRYPGMTKLTEELKKRIEFDYSDFEKALYSFDYNIGDYGYKNYIDTDSYVDYFVINFFAINNDAGRYSTYIYKNPGEKYKMCVWDFNNACDNYVSDVSNPDIDIIHAYPYFEMLFRDREFVEKVIFRYRELRETVLSDTYIDSYIDDTLAFLGDAVARDSERWAEYLTSNPLQDEEMTGRNPHSNAEAVLQLKNCLHARGAWLDENIDYLRQYSAASANKLYHVIPK